MKTVALFYSLTGKTRAVAEAKSKEIKADLIREVKETKQRSKFNAHIQGTIQAMQQKKAEIEPIDVDFDQYGRVLIFMPVWGGNPAPAMNSVIELLPRGKEVELYMTSPKGVSAKSADNTTNKIQKRGSWVVKYMDVKTGD